MKTMLMIFGPPELKNSLEEGFMFKGVRVFSYCIFTNATGNHEADDVCFDVTRLNRYNEGKFNNALEEEVTHIIVAVTATVLEEQIDNLLNLKKPLIILSEGHISKDISKKIWKAKGKAFLFHKVLDKIEGSNKGEDRALIISTITAINFLNTRKPGVFSPLNVNN